MKNKSIAITGGCGFIGTNAASFYLNCGYKVIVIDNLSRQGSKENLKFLKQINKDLIFKKIDITNKSKINEIFKKYRPERILHLAAQTTVVDSLKDPVDDFMINALGTINILESTKKYCKDSVLIYSSTNKVFGNLNDLDFSENKKRYFFPKTYLGVSEKQKIAFETPYGCSKGCGDQYVIDYRKNFGLNTCVFRQSCIYGPHQFGKEEQGWLAWFMLATLFNLDINIWGNGKQVRDVLYVDDLIRAYDMVFNDFNKAKNSIYNIGGGSKFSLSLLESLDLINDLSGRESDINFKDWRPGDQRIYISDYSLFKKDLNWTPLVSPKDGMNKLYKWISSNKQMFDSNVINNKK